MATPGKFDLSSGSPDRPMYASGQRASYTAASLDRSSSFRENMENPILSSLPNMSRSTSAVSHGDVTNFLQCLRFDPKAMAADLKFNRQGDFRRLASAALAAPDESPSGSSKGKPPSSSPEELKRLKAGVRESSIKARERVKIFSESLSVINKCFPSIPSRKRSRSDVLSGDRSNALLGDRSVSGPSIGKMGTQGHGIASGFEFEQQKVEERTKNTIPNKRTRTSMVEQRMEVRPNTPARSSGTVEREKEMPRLPNGSAVQGEDRTLPIVADGWEKAKMKKKRSVIKADVTSSPSPVAAKPIDGYREPKQGMHPRHLSDARVRINDSYGFRPGATNGVVGVGKADGTSQQTGLAVRSSIPRAEQDNSSLLHDRKDRSASSEKERTNLRAVNKANVREEFNSASPTSSTKLHATARAPRSGSGIVPKLSQVIQRATASNDWELSQCTTKNPGVVVSANRKRTPSTRSSSPPVAGWADRRPQKMSRTARRTNLVPIVSNNDESALDTSDVTGSENGQGFVKRLAGNSPQQVKLKVEHLTSATLSESEESGAAEIKSKDKSKKSDELEEKACQNLQKVSALVLPSRKNKFVNGEDDGVRRQGRTGRGFTSTRALTPMTGERLGNVGTAKQLRSARLGSDKPESKSGRPPTRKLSDRKAYTRQKHATINTAADFLVGSDDGHEELLAAANAVINPAPALSSPFWKHMEPLFGFVSDVDIAYLKQQESLRSTVDTKNLVPLDVDWSTTAPSGLGSVEPVNNAADSRIIEFSPENLALGIGSPGGIPLCQRLLAALISEGDEEPSCSGNEDLKFNVYGSGFQLETDIESGGFDHPCLQSFELAGGATFSSYRVNAKGRSCNELENSLSDNVIMSVQDTRITSSFDHTYNGLLPDQTLIPGVACSEYQYANMSINERLLLEIQSIGLYPEPVPDLAQTGDEDISGDISRMEEKYRSQVSRNKSLLDRLLKSTCAMRELQEKEFELHALEKLVGMAYRKYMSCWGPNVGGGKSASSKMARQAALAFVKRTLDRCQEFEATGKSCFTEPLFKEMFLAGASHMNATQADALNEGEPGKFYGNSMERVSGKQLSPSPITHDIYSSDLIVSVNHPSDQTIGKEDIWSNRVKKRELFLDDVVAGTAGTSGAPSGIGTAIINSAKGKRSERDRDGKGNSREVISRNGTAKIGRPASGNAKGERKSKAKLKQKTTQLSASVNGTLGKISDHPKPTFSSMPKSGEATSSKDKDEFNLEVLDNSEPIDISILGIGEDLGEQGQDIGSWLNIDDEGLQDDDFMGLEIPMDDLSDLNMMV